MQTVVALKWHKDNKFFLITLSLIVGKLWEQHNENARQDKIRSIEELNKNFSLHHHRTTNVNSKKINIVMIFDGAIYGYEVKMVSIWKKTEDEKETCDKFL